MSLGIKEIFPGKTADVKGYKPRSISRETCLDAVRKHLFQTTSNWLYVLNLQKSTMDYCLHQCIWQAYFVYESFTVVILW